MMAAEEQDLALPDPDAVGWEVLQPDVAAEDGSALLAEAEETASWERRDDEPRAAYGAFERFLAMGSGRTVAKFVREEANVEGLSLHVAMRRWGAMAQAFRWQERAAAYDEYRAGLELAAYNDDRLRLRKERMQMLQAYLRVLAQQVRKMGENPRFAADMGEVTAAMKMVMSELRTEYRDQPSDRDLESTRGGKRVVHFTDIQVFMRQMRQVTGEE